MASQFLVYEQNDSFYYYYMDPDGNGTFEPYYYIDENGTSVFYDIDHGYTYLFYVDGIALTCVSTFGIIGTILSMIVLLKPGIHDLFSSFLTALSICDSIFLLLAIFFLGLVEISNG